MKTSLFSNCCSYLAVRPLSCWKLLIAGCYKEAGSLSYHGDLYIQQWRNLERYNEIFCQVNLWMKKTTTPYSMAIFSVYLPQPAKKPYYVIKWKHLIWTVKCSLKKIQIDKYWSLVPNSASRTANKALKALNEIQ